jgi:S-adenosylmethionine synthetase
MRCREIGYVNDDDSFTPTKSSCRTSSLHSRPDIAQGGERGCAEGKGHAEQGAGDQGSDVRLRVQRDAELMPAPIMYAHRLGRKLTSIRKSGQVKWLRPDAKSQVSVIYDGNDVVGISNVVISTQHTPT